MATLTVSVQSPEEPFSLKWDNGKVSLSGKSEMGVADWGYLQSRGLYGKYGHSLDLKNCMLVDLVRAIQVLEGVEAVSLDEDAQKQVALELKGEEENPIPEGSQS
jgi:hypothetical protein